jgi:drug/metabolite transporter (DMT)-like permease
MSQTTRTLPSSIPSSVFGILFIGVLAASCAAIFIRFAQLDGMSSPVIAAGRLTFSALLLTPFTLLRHRADLTRLDRRDLLLGGAAGFFLAVHFASWIASLEYTSVLISVVFVSTGPLWVALLEWLFFKALFGRLVLFGLGLAFIGGLVIGISGSGDAGSGQQPVIGGGLALVGAITFALYLLIGRRVRAKLPLLPYIWIVYGFAALFLIALVITGGHAITGFSPSSYLWLIVLALVPQLIGHTSFNYALRYLPATFISITGQMEPIGSALLALIIFAELPTAVQIGGSAAVIVGVLLAIVGQRRQPS